MKIKSVNKIEQLNYLNSFEITYETKNHNERTWEIVSRGNEERLLKELTDGASYTDGAMVFATDASREHVVLLKEYRVSAGKYVYMLPAGLIDPDEDIMTAAAREFKEETGLQLEPECVEKERYTSVGIINEKVNIVYGTYTGTPSKAYQQESEEADILIINKEEALNILNNEEVAIRTAMLLQQFYGIHPFFNKTK